MALYGTPCRVSLAPQYGHWMLFYPFLQVEAFADDFLSPDRPISDITFADPAVPAALCVISTPALGGFTVQRAWQGFTSVQRYLKAVPER
jgi:hypothetical protein